MSSIGSGGANSWQVAIWEASGKGDEARVRELVAEGEKFGEKQKEVLSIALQKAVGRGHEPLTRLLLDHGAVDVTTKDAVPSIYRAAELGRVKVLKLLLEELKDADVDARYQFRTPIFPAAQRNHCEAVRILLNAGADVNVRDSSGQNVLLALASEKPEKKVRWGDEMLKILINANLDLETKDERGRTALLWAAATGRETLAELLLKGRPEHKADIRATNKRGKSALHLAAENNRLSLVKLFLDHGADINMQSDGNWTALHNAADKGHLEIASLLLERGANVNATTSSGMNPLHWCARNGHIAMAELLLRQPGARRNHKDSFDTTPMLLAAEGCHVDLVKMLSPSNEGESLSFSAKGACEGFEATIIDFGMENRPINHHNHSVYDVLYGWKHKEDRPMITTLTRNVPAKPTFRWIHLPSNNMSWVEALMSKYFVENSARDVEGFKILERSFSQAHQGPTVHSHFMRPLCNRIGPTGKENQASGPKEGHMETPPKEATTNGEPKVANKVAREKVPNEKVATPKKMEKGEKPSKTTSAGSASKKGRGGNMEKTRAQQTVKTPKTRDRHGNVVLFMPYLHYETHEKRKQMSNTINRALARSTDRDRRYSMGRSCDQMLIHGYLRSTYNLQVRRTLDQFYYHAISTEDRDEDQVVWRYTRDKGREQKLFMVDQLWLYILSDDLIITSFPQRWEQPKNSPLSVLDGIIEDMSSKTRPPVKSVYDLALLITGRCVGVFDRHSVHDGDYQFLDMFESSIGEVTNKETQLFKRFNDASIAAAKVLRDSHERRRAQRDIHTSDDDSEDSALFVDTLLDIGEETALLAETKDVRDELNMISMVLKHQLAIVDDLATALFQELKGNHNQDKQAEARRRFKEQHKIIEVHLKDVERMDKQAESIYISLTHLLDLKQKHANAIEARFARDQAAYTGQQGQVLMVFTLVTVIFLPMSFIAAVFAIPIADFPKADGNELSFTYVARFVFGVGLAISIPLIAIAFAVDNIRVSIKRAFGRMFSGKGQVKQRSISRSSTSSEDGADRVPASAYEKISGDHFRSRLSTDTEHRTNGGDIRHRTERSWRDGSKWKGRLSRDLERGAS